MKMDGGVLTEQKKRLLNQHKHQCSLPWNSADNSLVTSLGHHRFQQPTQIQLGTS